MRRRTSSRSLRKVLEKNKIFFETLLGVLLSGAAIYVSWLQYNAAKIQNATAEAEIRPWLSIKNHQVYDPELSFFTKNEVEIYNYGGLIENFKTDNRVFLNVSVYPKTDHPHLKSATNVMLLVDGYLFVSNPTGQPKDLLHTFRGHTNNLALSNLQKELHSLASTMGLTIFIDEEVYVKATYSDILQKHYTEFYHVQPVGNAVRMPLQQGIEKFNQFQNPDQKRVFDLGRDSSTNLLELVLEALKIPLT